MEDKILSFIEVLEKDDDLQIKLKNAKSKEERYIISKPFLKDILFEEFNEITDIILAAKYAKNNPQLSEEILFSIFGGKYSVLTDRIFSNMEDINIIDLLF